MAALREVCCSRLSPRIIDRDRISDPDQTAALNAGEHPPPAADLLPQARPKLVEEGTRRAIVGNFKRRLADLQSAHPTNRDARDSQVFPNIPREQVEVLQGLEIHQEHLATGPTEGDIADQPFFCDRRALLNWHHGCPMFRLEEYVPDRGLHSRNTAAKYSMRFLQGARMVFFATLHGPAWL